MPMIPVRWHVTAGRIVVGVRCERSRLRISPRASVPEWHPRPLRRPYRRCRRSALGVPLLGGGCAAVAALQPRCFALVEVAAVRPEGIAGLEISVFARWGP